jgi:hypothetical protein
VCLSFCSEGFSSSVDGRLLPRNPQEDLVAFLIVVLKRVEELFKLNRMWSTTSVYRIRAFMKIMFLNVEI